MWFFKKDKFKNLSHDDVSNALLSLERQLNDMENDLAEKDKAIDNLMERGKKEKSQTTKILLAKKITLLKEEKDAEIQRATFLMYNIRLMNKLRTAVDDNQFFGNISASGLNELLSDQKGLAKFLNKALDTRVGAESIMTEADDLFSEVQDSYLGNEQIYGQSATDDELLSMFESEVQMQDNDEFIEIEQERKKASEDK